ncbi:TPA: hypothetical protein DCX16_01370 [bacterium]|nr:hypothetical protein [bacterium]
MEIDYEKIREIIREELEDKGLKYFEGELGERWQDGSIIIKPGRKDLKEFVLPIEKFFHKIVMIRDRLRVLEAKLNSHPKLTDEDRIDLHQYITRIYGSLTTFNFLFKKRTSWFVGEKKE